MQMQTVNDIRKHFIGELNDGAFTTDKTGQNTIELLGASFIADEPAIFGTPNQEYINREIDWYISASTNIHDIYDRGTAPPEAWQYAADNHGNINSNYGYLIFSDIYYRQYDNVLTELLENPDSRRASMIYQRPSIWTEYNENGKSDFICTNAVTYYIRNDELQSVVQMRSNDVVYGYKNDYAWQQYVLTTLAKDLGIQPGFITWQVQNLHVYERHFNLVK
jgi:thymidylate synthase|tara:strand:+ start:413 stop:1075 length:663 start_codon:yes stop_codon:yes gene_type:complete